MEALLRSASDPSDLVHVSDERLPYRFDRVFRGGGWWARRLDRARLKLLRSVDASVRPLLAPEERVEAVTWGIEYSLVEHWLMGLWSLLLNRRAILATDRRLLLLQIDSRRRVRELRSQVRFAAVQRVARGSLGVLSLALKDRSRLVLTGMPRRDRRGLREQVQRGVEAARALPPVAGRENLCPHCGQRVAGFPERCSQCAKGFKSGSRAGWLSLLLPGLGDLYLGHRGLGVCELGGALLLWAFFGTGLLTSLQGGELGALEAGVAAGFVFVLVHGADALITRRVGRKGIYPA